MKNRKYMFLFLMIFMFVFSLSTVSADDFNTTESGTVSGDVDVATENPWSTSGELKYDIPSEAKEIKSAKVYVNVYSGSAKNTYGANANVSLKTNKSEKQIANEKLWIEEGSSDGTVYIVNNHTTKCYSDYQMYYDITDSLKGLNGTSISIKVDTYQFENKTLDGRIKLIGLTLAYDDGDSDEINYCINSEQLYTKTTMTTQFNTEGLKTVEGSFMNAYLINIALSNTDGSYEINNNLLGDAENHISGDYYQYNKWDVSDTLKIGENTTFTSEAGMGSYGRSLKNVLSVLKVKPGNIQVNATIFSEYTNAPTCYAGTNNTITIKIDTTQTGNYLIELLADDKLVNSANFDLKNSSQNTVLLTDPTIRNIDGTTASGAENNKVNYTVNIKYQGQVINSTSIKDLKVLYNGNLGKDLEYNAKYIEELKKITITGDIVIDIQNVSSYLGSKTTNRTDIWKIDLDNNSKITNAFIYIAYNWDNPSITGSILNVTFNEKTINYTSHYRDQSNLGGYGRYGYGLFIYDVSNLIQNGINTLTLNKTYGKTAIYPSTLIYLYNKTNSDIIKTIYIANGADLLSSDNNKAERIVKTDSQIDVNSENLNNATLYVFASGAQKGEGNIIFNSEKIEDVWNGTSSTTDIYSKDITKTIKDSNKISFVATGSTILALQQIIVTTTKKSTPTNKTNDTPTEPSKPPAKVTTKKVASKITAKKTITFKVKTKVKKYKITLKAGKKAIKQVYVTLTIKGKNYKVRTDKKGKATFKIKKLTKKGKYKAKIKFAGNKSYKGFTKKVKIVVK